MPASETIAPPSASVTGVGSPVAEPTRLSRMIESRTVSVPEFAMPPCVLHHIVAKGRAMLLRAAALTRTRALSVRASAISIAVVSAVLALAGTSDALAARKPVLSARDVVAKEATGAAAVKFVLARPIPRPVRFTVAPTRGTAQPADASFARRHAAIRRGRRSTVVRIPLRNDALNENTEDFFVTVSGGARLKPGRRVHVAIRDDDPMPTVSVADAAPVDEGRGPLVFTITLAAPSGRPVSVGYQTDTGPDAGTIRRVTFTPGTATPKPIRVWVNGDVIDEDDQLATLTLSAPVGAVVADGTATGLIRDTDPPSTVRLSSDSSCIPEGDEGMQSTTLSVRLRGLTAKPVTVMLMTQDGSGDPNESPDHVATGSTCADGGDYESFTDRVVTFTPGETAAAQTSSSAATSSMSAARTSVSSPRRPLTPSPATPGCSR